jgi:hypothetical protein
MLTPPAPTTLPAPPTQEVLATTAIKTASSRTHRATRGASYTTPWDFILSGVVSCCGALR